MNDLTSFLFRGGVAIPQAQAPGWASTYGASRDKDPWSSVMAALAAPTATPDAVPAPVATSPVQPVASPVAAPVAAPAAPAPTPGPVDFSAWMTRPTQDPYTAQQAFQALKWKNAPKSGGV